jgi:hypothetical protein
VKSRDKKPLLLLFGVTLLGLAGMSFAAQPQSFQTGTVTLPAGASAVTATILSVDTTKSFLTFSASFTGNEPGHLNVTGQLASSTQVVFTRRVNPAAPAVTLKWYVAEFSSGVLVQRGGQDMTAAMSVTVTLPTPVTLSRSFPLISYRSEGVVYDCNDFVRARLISTTQLVLSYNCTNPEGWVEWQVVDYTGATVTTGDIAFNNGDATQSVGVPAFPTNTTWMTFTYESDSGTDTNISQKMVRGRLTGGNTLTFDRDSTGQDIDLTWFLVQFTDGTLVQHGTTAFANGDLTRTAALAPVVDPARTLATAGGIRYGGGKSPYAADDNPGYGMGTLDITATNTLTLTRAISGSTADMGWFTVQFPVLPTPTLTATPTRTLTSTPTSTRTSTSTGTHTSTLTATLTSTPTSTNTATATLTDTPMDTVTSTSTPTHTSSRTATPSATNTMTDTETETSTATPSRTSTPTNTSTRTNTPTDTETETLTATPSRTSTPTNTSTRTETPTDTETETSTETPSRTATPSSTATRTETPTDTETSTLTTTSTRTATSSPTHTPTETPTLTSTSTGVPTDTSTATPSRTSTPTSTATLTETLTLTQTSTLTSTPTGVPTDTSTATATDTLSPTPTGSSTPTFTETYTSTISPTFTPTGSLTFTATRTSTRTATETRTATSTRTLTDTRTSTPTRTPTSTRTETATRTQTASVTSTPTGTLTPACGTGTVKIFDARGELVLVLCGGLLSPVPQSLDLADPKFMPALSGNGGAVTFFVNGQAAGVWDGKDGKGRSVPEGFYQVQLEQAFTDGTSATSSASLRVSYTKAPGIALSASPNLVYAGGSVQFTASWAGAPPPDGTSLRVHAITGEKVRVLSLLGGLATWDLKNLAGREVSSGVYLIRLEGPEGAPSRTLSRTVKIIVLR